MNEDMRSRVLGTIIGTLSRGSFPKREPVAFLYNGVRLQGLPVVPGFDFAYIGQGMGYFLYLTTAPCKVDQDGLMTGSRTGAESGTGLITYVALTNSAEWTKQSEGEVDGNYTYWNPFWANYNVETLDGKPFLDKSEPVPVYE